MSGRSRSGLHLTIIKFFISIVVSILRIGWTSLEVCLQGISVRCIISDRSLRNWSRTSSWSSSLALDLHLSKTRVWPQLCRNHCYLWTLHLWRGRGLGVRGSWLLWKLRQHLNSFFLTIVRRSFKKSKEQIRSLCEFESSGRERSLTWNWYLGAYLQTGSWTDLNGSFDTTLSSWIGPQCLAAETPPVRHRFLDFASIVFDNPLLYHCKFSV